LLLGRPGVNVGFMIDTTETGNKKLKELLKNIDAFDWTDWERSFLESNQQSDYQSLSAKQKTTVGNLYEKLTS
jgi:hypothetical protein